VLALLLQRVLAGRLVAAGRPMTAAACIETLATCRLNRYEPNELLDFDYSITHATQGADGHPAGPRHLSLTSGNATAARCRNADWGADWDRPGARAGLEPATVAVNAGSGCSAVAKPREAVLLKLVTCWYSNGIE
jgi:hypothetical protein